MDLVAGLHWLRENLGAFGGDPERLALLGHGTGAALANFLAVSPMAKGKAFNRFAACGRSVARRLVNVPSDAFAADMVRPFCVEADGKAYGMNLFTFPFFFCNLHTGCFVYLSV